MTRAHASPHPNGPHRHAVAPPTRTRDNHAHMTCPSPYQPRMADRPTNWLTETYNFRLTETYPISIQPRHIQFPSNQDISNFRPTETSNFRPTGPADTRSHWLTEDHHRKFGLGLTDEAHCLGDQADWGQSAIKVGRRCIVTCRLWAGILHNSSFHHPSNHISGRHQYLGQVHMTRLEPHQLADWGQLAGPSTSTKGSLIQNVWESPNEEIGATCTSGGSRQ